MNIVDRLKIIWRAPERMAEQARRIAVLEANMLTLVGALNDQVAGLVNVSGAIIDQANAIQFMHSVLTADMPGESVPPTVARVH